MKNLLISLIIGLAACLSSLNAATYYVDGSGGNDGNTGLSTGTAFKTIGKGLSKISNPGDTLKIKGGITYSESGLKLQGKSGTSSQPIDITNYGSGLPIINGGGFKSSSGAMQTDNGIMVIDCAYVSVRYLSVKNTNGPGIGIYANSTGSCRDIRVANCVTDNTGKSGIYCIGVNGLTINGNVVSRAVQKWAQECVSVVTCNSFNIYSNTVKDRPALAGINGGEALDMKVGCFNGTVHGNLVRECGRMNYYIDGWDKNSYSISLFRNQAHAGGVGFSVAQENGTATTSTNNIKIYNNIVAGSTSGFYMGANGIHSNIHKVKNVEFYSNTLMGNTGGINIANPDATNITIKNNIVAKNTSQQIQYQPNPVAAGIVVFKNMVFGAGAAFSKGGSNIVADPKVVNQNGWQGGYSPVGFKLQSSSPAIGAATATWVNTDFAQSARSATAPDIGAYEF